MPIHYVVHAVDDQRIDIHAEKINIGRQRLWFYDGEDNLQAVFRWDAIQGFTVVGSALGQVVIEELAHEKKVEKNKAELLERTHGPVVAALESADQALEQLVSKFSSAWLAVSDAKRRPSEASLLIGQRRGDLLRYQARLQDGRRDLELKMNRIEDDIKSLLTP
jgi:hypothetical protein